MYHLWWHPGSTVGFCASTPGLRFWTHWFESICQRSSRSSSSRHNWQCMAKNEPGCTFSNCGWKPEWKIMQTIKTLTGHDWNGNYNLLAERWQCAILRYIVNNYESIKALQKCPLILLAMIIFSKRKSTTCSLYPLHPRWLRNKSVTQFRINFSFAKWAKSLTIALGFMVNRAEYKSLRLIQQSETCLCE